MAKEYEFRFPDDDGERKRPWITDPDERGISACERVYRVFDERPWVTGPITITEPNCLDDQRGYDLFVPMQERLMSMLGIRRQHLGVPVQVKSSDRAVKEFVKKHHVFKASSLIFDEGNYIFAFNGQHARDLIVADMVGQMVMLASEVATEAQFLEFLAYDLCDSEAVERWIENKVIIKDSWWYRKLIK